MGFSVVPIVLIELPKVAIGEPRRGDLAGGRHAGAVHAHHPSGRILSAAQLPFFQLRPPRDVAIKGAGTTRWAKNALANPEVKLRLRAGRFSGRARELRADERERAKDAYSAHVGWFERGEWRIWRRFLSPEKSSELHRHWFDTGTPVVVELDRS